MDGWMWGGVGWGGLTITKSRCWDKMSKMVSSLCALIILHSGLMFIQLQHYSCQECSFALDIWQAGGCVLAMTTGRRPWRNLFMDPLCQQNTSYHFNDVKRKYGAMVSRALPFHSSIFLPTPSPFSLLHISSLPTYLLTSCRPQKRVEI